MGFALIIECLTQCFVCSQDYLKTFHFHICCFDVFSCENVTIQLHTKFMGNISVSNFHSTLVSLATLSALGK